ncbi:ThuA domain-containing protein [candidate division KSB1 bacterium]|nr:ThuA domain-containing protein [candidate division KSB1 bacterium]
MTKLNLIFILVLAVCSKAAFSQNKINILNFNGDTGYVHESKAVAVAMIEELGEENDWNITTTSDPAFFTISNLSQFDVIVFNNNCGTDGPIFEPDEQKSFQQFIRSGGGFVAIHCAGAVWHETGDFKEWYEKLVGTRLVAHPSVQKAKLTIENRNHISTLHLPVDWEVTDEWHYFNYNPRENVNVLISLEESSYTGKEKMNGDHPATWYHEYDGGRSFFTTFGHIIETYKDDNFRKIVEGGIKWAAKLDGEYDFEPIQKNLMLDLDANQDVVIEDGNRVSKWTNQVASSLAKHFVKRDSGRTVPGSGRPSLMINSPDIRGHNTLIFNRQELVNDQEDVFDHLLTGSGYTWFAVLAPYTQLIELEDVNSFFGNLRNGDKYEGIWGCLTDGNRPWIGSRSGKTFGRWDVNNPMVLAEDSLETDRYYLIMGRMGAGTGEVTVELFINDAAAPVASSPYPVFSESNASKMVIGQERDAVNHPGRESFSGEISRFLLYDRPLSAEEMKIMVNKLMLDYNIQK